MSFFGRGAHRNDSRQKKLRVERLEDRRVLAASADIVFIFDESESGATSAAKTWLDDEVFASTPGGSFAISDVLLEQGFTDVKYGLIGYGSVGNNERAHSYVLNSGADPLFGTAAEMDAALDILKSDGDKEDGWEGFEHLISEYKFRNGAVPVAILLQNTEGRLDVNNTLTRDGVFAALASKNILVNSLVYGSLLTEPDPAPLFDLTRYGADPTVRIFGVEADMADFVPDGQHNYVGIDTTDPELEGNHPTVTTAGATESDAVQVSHNGSNTGVLGMVGTGKSILFSKTASSGLGPVPRDETDYRATSVNYKAESFTGMTTAAGSLVTLPANFNFSYYGFNYNQLRVWNNGVITLGSAA